MIDLELTYKKVVKLVKKTYKKNIKIKENLIENKELNDIVTSIDKAMEKDIVAGLSKLFPTHSFLGEEFGEEKGSVNLSG